MAVTILVRDRNRRPVAKVKLLVKYKSGLSTVYTDEMGIAEVSPGQIEYINVYGKHKPVKLNARDGDSIPISYP